MGPLWLVLPVLLWGAPDESSVLASLERSERALARTERRLRELRDEGSELHAQLGRLEADEASATLEAKRAAERFKKRLRALVRMPAVTRAVLLGRADSAGQFLRDKRLLRRIATHDRTLRRSHVQQAERLATLQQSVRSRQAKLQRVVEETREQRDRLADERRKRLALLERVAREETLQRQVADERNTAREALTRKVRQLRPLGRSRERFASNQGRLPWPAAGKVRVGFGQRVELIHGTLTSHNGIDIAAAAGDRVQAVAQGKVAYADWLRGYGQIVILDHGDQYHTLVAHLATLAVTAGDIVQQGQDLGTVGDTGSLRGTVLYFEVRHRGTPVDPLRWLRRESP